MRQMVFVMAEWDLLQNKAEDEYYGSWSYKQSQKSGMEHMNEKIWIEAISKLLELRGVITKEEKDKIIKKIGST